MNVYNQCYDVKNLIQEDSVMLKSQFYQKKLHQKAAFMHAVFHAFFNVLPTKRDEHNPMKIQQ